MSWAADRDKLKNRLPEMAPMFALHEMSPRECVAVLERVRVGRLACCRDNRPYVVPIYFAYEANMIYSFSLPGQKIDWMRGNGHVCLQCDEHGPGKGWSCVVATGTFHEFPDIAETTLHRSEKLHAWALLQKHNDWWEMGALRPQQPATATPIYYGIAIESLTGRSVQPVEPD
jgi:nitroimidazol reductase NimA-like FMN-containing flavoprotein (pyridoxamine 5'-phosphate oxidase superfamily)